MLDRGTDWLPTLIADIAAICHAEDDSAVVTKVAARLADCGTECRLPSEYRTTSDAAYTQHLLHVAENQSFSVVALVWKPGQQTPIHDHRGWCAVAVCEGAECETRYRVCSDENGPYLLEVSSHVLEPGKTVALLPNGSDVHRVSNCSQGLTVSLHVYGLDIRSTGSSIASRFDAMPVRTARSA
ncbi:MAG: cysteine dioxygenase family protein [Candidatus Eremiobacteraeota bacterium]|nr:cysteine dioxygenase family protein [Candidatus Eremiobacteraeota bacterium]